MKDAPNIKGVIVQLQDGMQRSFTAEHIAIIRDFAGENSARQWKLLEFITAMPDVPDVAPPK